MSLEAFTGWIKDLVATNPTGTDPKSQGDDHLRGIKGTLLAQFSGLNQGKAITVNEDQINSVLDRVLRAGDTMTGVLVLVGDAAGNLEAVPLQQLVAKIAESAEAINVGVATKVNRSGDTMTGMLEVQGYLFALGNDNLMGVKSNSERALGLAAGSDGTDRLFHLSDGGVWDGAVLSVFTGAGGVVARMAIGAGSDLTVNVPLFLARNAVVANEAVTLAQLDARTSPTAWANGLARDGNTTYTNASALRHMFVIVDAISGPQDMYIGGVAKGPAFVGRSFVVPPGGNYRIGTPGLGETSTVSEILL